MKTQRQRDLATGLGLVSLAAILRGLFVLSVSKHPLVLLPLVDSRAYHVKARRILEGDWLGSEVFYQDPLYPYLLAALYGIFGAGNVGVLLAQAALDALTVGFVYGIARRLFDYRTAVLAGLLATFYKLFFFYDALLLKVALTVLLIAAALHLLLLAAERDRRGVWLAAGAVLGIATLTRGNYLLFVPIAVGWAAFAGTGTSRERAVRAALVAAGVAAAILPVTVRNAYVGGDVVLVTSQAGQNLYIGNFRGNDSGRYRPPPFVTAHPFHEEPDFRAEALRRTGRTAMKPSEVSRFWLRETLGEIGADPGHFVRHAYKKATLLVNHYEVPASQSFDFFREQAAPVLSFPGPSWGVLLPLALLGMFAARRSRQALLPMLFFATYASSVILTFNMSRYRMPLVPVAVVFAAAGTFWLVDRAVARRFGAVAIALALLATGWALVHRDVTQDDFAGAHFNLGIGHSVQAERHRTHAAAFRRTGKSELAARAGAAAREQDRLAEAEFRRGLEIRPDHPRLREALDRLLLFQVRELEDAGRLDEALALALEASGSTDGLVALGRLYSGLGRYPEAREALGRALVREPAHAEAQREREFLRELEASKHR